MDEEKSKINEDDLHFYYERDRRLQKSPSLVRSHYDGTAPTVPRGFFRGLVHTRMSRFLAGGIVLSILILFLGILASGQKDVNFIDDIKFQLSAFSYEDTIYVTLTAFPTEIVTDNILDISFHSLGIDKIPLNTTKIQLIYDGNENFYRTTFEDYDILQVEATISIAGETAILITSVQK